MIFERRIPTPAVVAVLVAAAAGIGYWAFRRADKAGRQDVHYPYYCTGCKKVFDVEVLRADGARKWRIAPGGGSDSVVICPFCNTGRAYPAATCPKCGTRYLLHLAGDGRCPECYPHNAEAAKAKGVDLTPPELAEY